MSCGVCQAVCGSYWGPQRRASENADLRSRMWTGLCVVVLAVATRPTRPIRRPAPALPDRPVTWSNPQGTSLSQIAGDVWLAGGHFVSTLPGLTSTDVACKAAVVRLPDGKLWVHAPVGLDEPLRKALAELGEVGHDIRQTPSIRNTRPRGLSRIRTQRRGHAPDCSRRSRRQAGSNHSRAYWTRRAS